MDQSTPSAHECSQPSSIEAGNASRQRIRELREEDDFLYEESTDEEEDEEVDDVYPDFNERSDGDDE